MATPRFVFSAIALGLSLGLWSGVASAAPSRKDLDRVLGGFERAVDGDAVKSLGPGTAEALMAYVESDVTSLRRQRALGALRFVPSVAAREFLLARLQTTATRGPEVLELASAIGALSPYGGEVVPSLLPFLSHVGPDVRQSAAAALGAIGDRRARASLQARFAVETDPGVKTALARAIEAMR